MNRRTAIKTSSLIALLGLTGIDEIFSNPLATSVNSLPNFHSLKVGKLDIMIFSDGHTLLKPLQPIIAPNATVAEMGKLMDENFLSKTEIDLSLNIMVIKNGEYLVLVDTGCGNIFGKESGWLKKNLEQAGIAPEKISAIILSHAHPDHIGGLTDGTGNLVFPNAIIHISKVERDFWTSDSPDFSKCLLKDTNGQKQMVGFANSQFKAEQKNLQFFESGMVLFGCIALTLAPGHTPGHTILRVFSEGEELVHLADLVHSPVVLFEHPEWGFQPDTDFDLAVKTRRKVLGEVADTRTLAFAYHLPWPGIGHVKREGKHFRWMPKVQATQD